MHSYSLSYLKNLESESIHIMREVAAEFKKPVMLYSVGKDSSVMVRLAQKAFYPGEFPFPLMHIDTGYKFPEMYVFREEFCRKIGAKPIVEHNKSWTAKGCHLIVAVNEMDRVNYAEDVYTRIVETYLDYSQKLDIQDVSFIPVSALKGDNIVEQSKYMPWYKWMHKTASSMTTDYILIDPLTNNTVAAGMIRSAPREIPGEIDRVREDGAGKVSAAKSTNVVWSDWNIPREVREKRHGHRAAVLWFTGYSGSGKSTIGKRLESKLFEAGCRTILLDGDQMRHGLCGDLGFSEVDRRENIRRVGEVARLFFEAGHIVICAFISPFDRDRRFVRSLLPDKRFFEIHVKCDLETCIQRDPHGLYKRAFSGEIAEFTGVSSPYETPLAPEIVVDTELHSAEQSCDLILGRLIHDEIIQKVFSRRKQ